MTLWNRAQDTRQSTLHTAHREHYRAQNGWEMMVRDGGCLVIVLLLLQHARRAIELATFFQQPGELH